MAELFDSYDHSYDAVVQSSIDFSGLSHNFFMAAKADMLRDLPPETVEVVRRAMASCAHSLGATNPAPRPRTISSRGGSR